MVKMSPETKDRFTVALNVVKCSFHWGFIPAVLFLGFRKGPDPGMPDISILSLLWQ